MLATLVDEMLYSPVSDVRLYAAVAIQATPYRGPVAAALGTELSRIAANPGERGTVEAQRAQRIRQREASGAPGPS
jgi:hypothetical protein